MSVTYMHTYMRAKHSCTENKERYLKNKNLLKFVNQWHLFVASHSSVAGRSSFCHTIYFILFWDNISVTSNSLCSQGYLGTSNPPALRPEHWNYRHVLLCLVYLLQGIKSRALSTNWATLSTPPSTCIWMNFTCYFWFLTRDFIFSVKLKIFPEPF